MRALIVLLTLLLTMGVANARPRHHHQQARVEASSTGRPAECYGIPWCGCWLRIQKGIADKRYNLASFWHNFGTRVAGPVVGAVARLNHHVGLVVGVSDRGNPIIRSGNHNRRVADAEYPKRRVIEYRM